MKFRILALIMGMAVVFSSCGESKEEKERKIKQLLMNAANGVACVSLTLTPDSLDKEMQIAIGIMEDSSRVEAYIKYNDKDEPMARETFSSFLAREIGTNVGMRITDMSLKQIDNAENFKGKALLKSGEKINFHANPNKGWYPENEIPTLETIVKYQVSKGLPAGQKVDSIGIYLEAPSRYRGKYKLNSGVEQWIYVAHTGTDFSWTLSRAYTPPTTAEEKAK
ncbi:MAG: hypothetical protein EAZ08_03440 [Cytophagales bacterium]|nr:MAG: hypothetical protein EAZ08_03440 [Cytophagales bacterium]